MRLLHRSTRALHLTQFGETYLLTCREVLSALDAAERGAAAEQERPGGLLTITAPLRFGQLHMRPVLDEFLDTNPAVWARLLLLDRVVNLVEEGIDLALRMRICRIPASRQHGWETYVACSARPLHISRDAGYRLHRRSFETMPASWSATGPRPTLGGLRQHRAARLPPSRFSRGW